MNSQPFRWIRQALTGAALLFFAACVPPLYTDKHVLFVVPTLDAEDVCGQGLCVMPFYDTRTDSIRETPSARSMEALIRNSGHRQLKLIPYKKVMKKIRRQTGRSDLFYLFEKDWLVSNPAEAPASFWKNLSAGYFLRFSVRSGDKIKLFDGKQKVSLILDAHLYHVASRKVVWSAQSQVIGTFADLTDTESLVKTGLASLTEILPVNPKVSYIQPRNEVW